MQSRSRAAASGTFLCCLTGSPNPTIPKARQRHGRRSIRHSQMPRCDYGPECPCRHTAAQECQVMEARYTRGQSTQRSRPTLKVSGPRIVATDDRISPQKPRRNEDALCENTRSASLGARLRSPGCADLNPCCDPQRLHSSWYTAYRNPRLNPSWVRGRSTSGRFVQQRRYMRST